ncbi:hypothetical protein EGH24_00210 [Halonotius terrestris]|uniref:Uncharacterized protein n=1 Tax=Halonotius terrestris TaxID=2487750 RepID=A0A8J8PAZ5_9EURY|nr:hypothetical protein [Halonotius terrestris]TQQ83264.1 hypothetical protein EGH24_00210 [Halonotius terrestris]
MSAEPPTDWAVQDWLLVAEGLSSRFHPEDDSKRARRGWRLLETVCQACEVDATEYIFEIDDEWGAEAAAAAGPDAHPDSQPVDRFDETDWQLVADALTEIADRETETTRTQRAAALAQSVASREPSVSLRAVSES